MMKPKLAADDAIQETFAIVIFALLRWKRE
jgi:hypothetical protein